MSLAAVGQEEVSEQAGGTNAEYEQCADIADVIAMLDCENAAKKIERETLQSANAALDAIIKAKTAELAKQEAEIEEQDAITDCLIESIKGLTSPECKTILRAYEQEQALNRATANP